jgi:hypothetical protein
MQEIQEALDERQNNLDSLLAHNQANIPFAFESQTDTDINPLDLSAKSIDESLHLSDQAETNISNETVPLLAVPNEKTPSKNHHGRQSKSSWTSTKDRMSIKKEPITPVISISDKNKTTSIKKFNKF